MKNDHDDVLRSPPLIGYADTYVRLSKYRDIFLTENVTKKTGADISALLLYYDNMDQDPIRLHIHSNGGDTSGLANIYDTMQMIKSPVYTYCFGKAYSAGAVILASGDKGNRYISKNAEVMIHGIQFIFPLPGDNVLDSKNYYQFLNEENDNIMKIMAKHTGKELLKLKEDCSKDFWMDAKQALAYGIVDEII